MFPFNGVAIDFMVVPTVSHVKLGVRRSSAKLTFPMHSQDKLYTIMLLLCSRGLVLNFVLDIPL